MKKELLIQGLPTDFCHASTLLVLDNGEVLCCWFGGTHEGNADVAIFMSRRSAEGVWSLPIKLADGVEANWNPVLHLKNDGVVQLFYKEGQQIASWRTLVMESEDNGQSWNKSHELVPYDCSGGRGPVRNKLLRLSNGRLVAGASTEHGLWKAYADISDDDGLSWRLSNPIAIDDLEYHAGEKTAASDIAVSEQSFYGRGVIQPSLWEGSDGNVHMLLRSSEGFIYRSDSTDGGISWCSAYPTDIPNNNSGLDLVKGANGCLYLVCNPVAANWGMRSPLSLFQSKDDGKSWERMCDLESESGEFSYPAIVAYGSKLYISYTYKRVNIAFLELELL